MGAVKQSFVKTSKSVVRDVGDVNTLLQYCNEQTEIGLCPIHRSNAHCARTEQKDSSSLIRRCLEREEGVGGGGHYQTGNGGSSC